MSYIRVDLDSNLLEVDKIKDLNIPALAVNSAGVQVPGVELLSENVALSAVLYNTKQVYLSVDITGTSIYGPEGIESTNGTTAISIKGSSEDLAKVNKIATELVDIKQHGAAGVGIIRHVSVGQPPDEPCLYGTEKQFAFLRPLTGAGYVIQDPPDLRGGKIGVDQKSGGGLDALGKTPAV